MSQIADRVRDDIIDALQKDELTLPTLPEVALRVREVADDPDASLSDLARVIGNDAALSARIIRVTNNPAMRGNRHIEDLKTALGRLGMDYTCSLATGLAMEQMFQATSDLIDRRLREVWSRSTEVSGICYVLSKHYTNLRPDQATLAGLVHKIGVLPILSYAENHPALLADGLTLDRVIGELQGPLGDHILKAWAFPEELQNVPSEHLKFNRQAPKADYADIVTVALLQSHLGDGSNLGTLDCRTVTAFERLGMDPDIQSAEARDLGEALADARHLLQ